MRVKKTAVAVAAFAGMTLAACGSSNSASSRPTSPGFYIQISGYAFSPLNMHAPAGATVTVLNDDSMPHSATSETMMNSFMPGSVGTVSFDTGQFTGVHSFTLPPGVANGTAIPYYCSLHKGAMATPNGTVTIDSTAKPAPPPAAPGGGGSGY